MYRFLFIKKFRYNARSDWLKERALSEYRARSVEGGPIARFRYFKIQLERKEITTRLRGINHINLSYHSPKPRSDVFCFKLNFNISKLGCYCLCFGILTNLTQKLKINYIRKENKLFLCNKHGLKGGHCENCTSAKSVR